MLLRKDSKELSWYRKAEGRIAPPLLLWFFGVPGGVCLLLWLFFFRG